MTSSKQISDVDTQTLPPASGDQSRPRRIAHLDMDAFYASVELLRYPDLRGQAVVVGGRRLPEIRGQRHRRLGDYSGRGVVTTASYEARQFGVRSAMSLMKAGRLAPDAILLPADFDEYRRFSQLFKEAVRHIAPLIEDRGIDEIYIDLTPLHGSSEELAQHIKQSVKDATGLTCSIGITPNKLLSKLASEMDKPDGSTILGLADIPERIWPLPASAINGIGPKATAKLLSLGIHTIGELAAATPELLITRFGERFGKWLHESAHGRDTRPVVTVRERKSCSRETTFERDLDPRMDRSRLSAALLDLCARVSADLIRLHYVARTIGVKLRYEDFRVVTRDITLPAPTNATEVIRASVRTCLKRVDLNPRLRLLGVRAASLSHVDNAPASDAAADCGTPNVYRQER